MQKYSEECFKKLDLLLSFLCVCVCVMFNIETNPNNTSIYLTTFDVFMMRCVAKSWRIKNENIFCHCQLLYW